MKDPFGQVYYYHSDHLGSSTVVTYGPGPEVGSPPNPQIGDKYQELAYYPYGQTRMNTLTSGGVRHKYTGQEEDDSTGLYYYHARYYDPVLARFTQPDDATTDHYLYAGNNPMTYVDPSGNFSQSFGSVSMFTFYDPKISSSSAFPDMNFTLPPAWSVPSFMDASRMGPQKFMGTIGAGFSTGRTTVIEDPGKGVKSFVD